MVDIVLISIFINLVTCSFLSVFLLSSKYKTFAIFNLNLVCWGIFYALYIRAEYPEEALVYAKLCSAFIVFIPLFALYFAVDLCNYKLSNRSKIINTLVALTLFIMMSSTSLAIRGVKSFLDFKFIPDVTIVYYLLLIYYAVNVVWAHVILYKNIKSDLRVKFVFTGFAIGFTGGTTNIFPYIGIPVYPIGNFLIAVYCCLLAYAILKHRLFDSSFIINRGLTRLFSLMVLIIAYVVLWYLYHLLIANSDTFTTSIFNTMFLVISCESYQILMSKFQKLLPSKSYEYNSLSKKLNQELSNIVNLSELQGVLDNIFVKNLKLKISALYVVDYSKSINEINFSLKKHFGDDISEDLQNCIVKEFFHLEMPTKYGEVLPELQEIFDRTNSSCYVPFINSGRVLGFMLVEERSKNHHFTYDDMTLFDNLTFQMGAVLDRTMLHNKILEQEREGQEQRAQVLHSLAASIAHEMRNPFAATNLAVENNKDIVNEITSQPNSLVSSHQKSLQEIINNSNTLLSAIKRGNDIINITLNEMKGEKPDPETFVNLNIKGIVDKATKEYGYKSNEEKAKVISLLDNKKSFIFKGDENLFIYVLFNLIKNALYYTTSYPSSAIIIGSEESKHGKYNSQNYNTIYVEDTGPGITSDLLPKLFGDFVTSGKKEGTGLGLAFCKRTMLAFGGDIICESRYGGGEGKSGWTRFTMFFPKVSEDEIKASQLNQNSQSILDSNNNAKPKKVLIVDDQEINILVTQKCIKSLAPNVVFDKAFDGKEALHLVQKHHKMNDPYDLIVMDLQMPVMDGIEATKKIREFDNHTPIISNTSRNSPKIKEEALNAGIDNYISKPIPNNGMTKAVSKWLINNHRYNYEEKEVDSNISGKKVLIADDEEMNLMMLKNFFKKHHMEVDTAKDGEELVTKYKAQFSSNLQSLPEIDVANNPMQKSSLTNRYDIIVTDVNMPKVRGDDAIKEIRRLEIVHNIHNKAIIIANSGDSEEEVLHQILRKGADDYFVKGNNNQNLLQELNFWLLNSHRYKRKENNDLAQVPQIKVAEPQVNQQKEAVASVANYTIANINAHPLISDKLTKEDVAELKDLFISSAKRLINNIKQSQHKKDLKQLAFDTHALKGIAGNIGAERLFVYVSVVNSYVKNDKLPDEFDGNWFDNLSALYAQTAEQLK